MFPVSKRVPRAEFARWYKLARKYHAPDLILCYAPHHHLQVSVVVSKKVATKAVTRNRIRRQLYAQMRTIVSAQTGVFIVITKPSIRLVSPQHIITQLEELCGRISKTT